MIELVNRLVMNIESSSKQSKELIPAELISILESFEIREISRFFVESRKEGLIFSGSREPVRVAQQAYDLVKESTNRSDKVFYSLLFVGLMYKVTYDTVRVILLERLAC